MPIQNRMTTRPDAILDYDILGLQQRRHEISQQTEGPMKSTDWIEIDDGVDDGLDRKVSAACAQLAARLQGEIIDKELSPFESMCEQMLAAYSEMGSEKFRELMARQLALLGPAASIADLLRGLTDGGVVESRSAPGFRHMTLLEQINFKNAADARAGCYPYR